MSRVRRPSRLRSRIRAHPRVAIAGTVLVAVLLIVVGWRVMASRRGAARNVPAPVVATALAVAQAAPRPRYIVKFTEGCVTAECHAAYSTAAVVHAPMAGAACDACHLPDAGDHKYPLRQSRGELCAGCHDVGRHEAFRHGALTEDGCLACHDAHVSTGRFLLKAETEAKTCGQCHPGTAGLVRHGPYDAGQCAICHEPHGADNRALLRGGVGEGNCRLCHAELASEMAQAGEGHSHADVEGSCLACHGAHATDFKGLMKARPRDRCVVCHEDVGRSVGGAIVSHDAVLKGEQCITCHAPHVSPNPKMLRDDEASVCLGCHDKPVVSTDGRTIPEMATVIRSAPVVHGPVAAGQCAACHSVHGGGHAKLLRQVNPEALVGEFDVRNYALCFSCHDSQLATAESGLVTQFRNGTTNLHAKHLHAGERSRSCAACHAVHGGAGSRLIAETVSYDTSPWKMSMGYQATPDGGGCAPGCHEPLKYSRTGAGIAAPAKGADRKGGVP